MDTHGPRTQLQRLGGLSLSASALTAPYAPDGPSPRLNPARVPLTRS